jgi:hypothetical protein
MLITKVIELLEDFVYLLYEFFGLVGGDHLIKVLDYDINDRSFTFLICMIFLANSNFVSHKRRYKYIQYLLQLDIILNPRVAPHKLYFLLKLLKVDICRPTYSHKYPDSRSVALDSVIDHKSVTDHCEKYKHEN